MQIVPMQFTKTSLTTSTLSNRKNITQFFYETIVKMI